jgi:hypothetical protein
MKLGMRWREVNVAYFIMLSHYVAEEKRKTLSDFKPSNGRDVKCIPTGCEPLHCDGLLEVMAMQTV